MSLILRQGQVFRTTTLSFERMDVLLEGNRIVALGPKLTSPAGAQELNATDYFVLPGLINAHTHAHNNLLKCLGDNWTLEDLLNHRSAVYGNRTVEDQYLSAAIGAIEMLKTGCTAAYDLCAISPVPTDEGVEAVVRAYVDVGMRVVIAPSVSDLSFYETLPGFVELLPIELLRDIHSFIPATKDIILKVTKNAIRRWNGFSGGRIQFGFAPTIPGQCSDTLLKECGRLAREYDVGLHTHLVETKVQALYAWHRWGKSQVAHLSELGLLGPRFVGAHGVWLNEDDIKQLADHGCSIAHNPASNLKLGSGIAPIRELLDSGVNVGLATDGSMSSDNQNMFEALRFAALISKIRFPHQPDLWIGAKAAWQMATTGSAKLLGLADDIGAIEPGRKADLILLRSDSAFLRPMNHPVNALVYAETGADVDTVLVDGRIVLQHGRVVTVDEETLRRRAQESADRLRAENSSATDTAQRLAPYIKKACQTVVTSPYSINRYAAPLIENSNSDSSNW